MIKVNSKVIIKELHMARQEWLTKERPPLMIVEGLYYQSGKDFNILPPDSPTKPELVKCVWYNTRNELQSEFINLELLTEL